MPEKVIPLDDPGRKLIIRREKRGWERYREDRLLWVFLLDEAEYQQNNEQPFEVCSAFVDQAPEQVARTLRSRLYDFVPSSWLDESWVKEIEPQIISFVTGSG